MVYCPEGDIISHNASLLPRLWGRTETDGAETKPTISPRKALIRSLWPITFHCSLLWRLPEEEQRWWGGADPWGAAGKNTTPAFTVKKYRDDWNKTKQVEMSWMSSGTQRNFRVAKIRRRVSKETSGLWIKMEKLTFTVFFSHIVICYYVYQQLFVALEQAVWAQRR